MLKQYSAAPVIFVLICSIAFIGVEASKGCKRRPECAPPNSRCRVARCQQCFRVEPRSLLCKICRKARKINPELKCRRQCNAFLYCEKKKCFRKCPRVPDGPCECALSNKAGTCVKHWSEYGLIRCSGPAGSQTCAPKLWKKKCRHSPSPSTTPTPTSSPSASISPSVSPSPSSTPLKKIGNVDKTSLEDVIGQQQSIPLDRTQFAVDDMVTIAGIKVTGGTYFTITVNEGEKKFIAILSTVPCTTDTRPIAIQVRESVTVKDIGKGLPGIFYEVEATPFGSTCDDPFFEFEILNAS